MNIPKAFISYSHDTQEHKKWTLELATRLRNNGIDARLDQWELQPGADLPHFMETNLASADKIIMICTDKYVEKANKGEGGVGYEKMIITSNLMQRINENKIIPIVIHNGIAEVPTFLKSKIYINFSKKDDFEFSYDELVRSIHNSPLFEKPPIGNNPFKPIVKEKLDDSIKLLNVLLGAILREQGTGLKAFSPGIISELQISDLFYKVSIIKLINMGFVKWTYNANYNYVTATDKGLIYAFDNGLVE